MKTSKSLLQFRLGAPALGAVVLLLASSGAEAVRAVRGPDRTAVATRRGVAVSGPHGAAVARRPLPRGYVRVIPAGARRVVYRGYNAYLINGVYYRVTTYDGQTAYVRID